VGGKPVQDLVDRMKIRSPKEPLLAAVQAAAAVVPTRSPKPVLTNIKFEAGDGGAIVSATDLEIGIRAAVEGVETLAAGSVLLPSSRLVAILRESPAGTVFEIESDGTAAVVKAARSQFRLPVEDPLEFPSVAAFPEGPCFELSTPLVRELVRRTVFATDNESSRYALGGVLVELGPTAVIAVGTDGRRLAKMEGPCQTQGGDPGEAQPIVPSRAMQLVERSLGAAEEPVLVAVRGSEILVRVGQTTISARLVEGRFPRWRDVFPERPEAARVQLVAGPMLGAVRQAAIVTSDQSKGVDFSFEPGQLVLAGRSAESGESRVELPIDYAGEAIRIKLDPRFVSEFLRVLDGGTGISVEITDSQSACVCRTEDGYGYVIMPLAAD
jgi:DNA polymerase-3 subunit beta